MQLNKRQKAIEKLQKEGVFDEIDAGILDVVIALNSLGVNTKASCEGHLDWGCANPWIDIDCLKDTSNLEEQAQRFFDTEQFADYWKIIEEASIPHLKEREKLFNLLEEFYKNRPVSYGAQLHVWDFGNNISRLESIDISLQPIRSKKLRQEKLKQYQAEMSAFGKFLQQKITSSCQSKNT